MQTIEGKKEVDSMNANHFILAYDFGGTKVSLATTSMEGELWNKTTLDSRQFSSGSELLNAAIASGDVLTTHTKQKTRGNLCGIGISTMGITFPDRVDMAPNVYGWNELHIEEAFKAQFAGVPIVIENDVKAAAIAEIKRGKLKGIDVGMYVNLGTGISVALTLDDHVVRGSHSASGEIAYCLRSQSDSAGYEDGTAPFEEFAGGKGIEKRAIQEFGQSLSAHDLFVMAESRVDIAQFIENTMSAIAFQLTNALILWDPSRIVVGGGMVGAKHIIFPYLTDHFRRFVPYPPEIHMARFQHEAGLFGAIELARTVTTLD